MSDHQIASGAQFAPTFSLQGRTALVTGASRGIGWAAAVLLHRRGARVALVGRSGGFRSIMGSLDGVLESVSQRVGGQRARTRQHEAGPGTGDL